MHILKIKPGTFGARGRRLGPVAPTLIKQFILASRPTRFFIACCLILQKGHSRANRLKYFDLKCAKQTIYIHKWFSDFSLDYFSFLKAS